MSSSSMMRSWFTKGMIAEIKACNEANTTMEMAALEEEMADLKNAINMESLVRSNGSLCSLLLLSLSP